MNLLKLAAYLKCFQTAAKPSPQEPLEFKKDIISYHIISLRVFIQLSIYFAFLSFKERFVQPKTAMSLNSLLAVLQGC